MMTFLTPKQLRQALHMTKSQYEMLQEAGMPSIQIDTKVRFCKKDVVTWLTTYWMQQEQAETDFKDVVGRTIEAYATIEQVAHTFQVKKKDVRSLCAQGLPHEIVGTKLFFSMEKVFAFFQHPIQPVPTPKKEKTLIIVDGSFHKETNTICAGMVVQNENGRKGFSYVYDQRVEKANICEYYAVYQALRYVKEKQLTNVIIGTDQVDFIRSLNKGIRTLYDWMRMEPYKGLMDNLNELWDELKDEVTIKYANEPAFKTQYNQAHRLSRYYENVAFDDLNSVRLKEASSTIVVKPENRPKMTRKLKHSEGLHIDYHSMDKKYVYFLVTNKGVIKNTKMLGASPTRAALLLAHSYAQFANEKLNIQIGKMPTFEKDVYQHGLHEKSKQKTIDFVEQLFEQANVTAEDDLQRYLHALKKQTQIA